MSRIQDYFKCVKVLGYEPVAILGVVGSVGQSKSKLLFTEHGLLIVSRSRSFYKTTCFNGKIVGF